MKALARRVQLVSFSHSMRRMRLSMCAALAVGLLTAIPAVADAAAPTCGAPAPLEVRSGSSRLVPETCVDPGRVPPIAKRVIAAPTHGAVTWALGGPMGYRADAGYSGPDAFTFVAYNDDGTSSVT